MTCPIFFFREQRGTELILTAAVANFLIAEQRNIPAHGFDRCYTRLTNVTNGGHFSRFEVEIRSVGRFKSVSLQQLLSNYSRYFQLKRLNFVSTVVGLPSAESEIFSTC
jgi:hypothetical protein